MPGAPLPSNGFPGAGSPASSVLSAHSDFSSPIAPCFVAFAQRYHRASRFAPPGWDISRWPGPLVTRRPRRSSRWRTRDLPGSWATPTYMLRSSTPADLRAWPTLAWEVLPSAYSTTSAPHLDFRGCIAQPAGSLCTLRSRNRSRTTQHSVPAGGQPLPGQDFHLLGRKEGFHLQLLVTSTSPFTKLCLAQ